MTLIRRESRTLLQYVVEAFPWTKTGDGDTVRQLQQVGKEEAEAAAAVAVFLRKEHLTPPALGAFPSHFTRFNFLGLERLVPLVLQQHHEGIAALEEDLRHVTDPAARQQFESFLMLKQRHLKSL